MSLPIINISQYLSSSLARRHIAGQIRLVCKENGFFCIQNHGVPESLQKSLIENTQKFFYLPQSIKKQSKIKFGERGIHGYFSEGQEITSGKIDYKQGLWLGQQLFQTQIGVASKAQYQRKGDYFIEFPELRKDIICYFKEMERLGNTLIQAVAESLYLDSEFFLQSICKQHLGQLGLLRYPFYQDLIDKNEWGVGEHTDYGLLTILKMTEPGLQIRKVNDEWIEIDPIPNTYVINIGDILQKMTRGLYKSVPHRVRNNSKRARLSFPYFYDPGWNAQIKELNIQVDNSELEILNKNKKYERWDQVKLETISGTYGEYQMKKILNAIPNWQQAKQL